MRRTLTSAVLAASMILAVPSPRAAADPPPPGPCPTILGCGDDLEAAVDLERKIADNMWGGQVYEIDYAAGAERTRDNITSVNHFGDSALWTGTYLGAQSLRYAVAERYLGEHPLPGGDRRFWNDQLREAKARVQDMVAKFHVLINISQYWNHQFQPSTAQAGFGGGIVNGEPGYLMRACIPADVPEWQRWSDAQLGPDPTGMPRPYTADRRIFGPFPWPNPDGTVTQYFCEDGTSRDAYAGTIFGLLLAFDLVGPDDDALRTQVRDDVVTLANFAFKYLWNTPRPHGRISIPFDSNHNSSTCRQIDAVANICGHDFENFFSPLFVLTPTAQMELTQAAYHVVTRAPGHPDTAKWMLVQEAELAAMTPFLGFSLEVDATDPWGSYFKWNLEHLIAYNLVRDAPDAATDGIYRQAFGVMDATTGDDVNAHFEAIMFGITGEQQRLDAAVQHVREWRDYRARIETGVPTDNRQLCGASLDCVPKDQVDVTLTPGTAPVVVPGRATDVRAHGPLPVAARPPTDFLWQRPPNQLNGSESPLHQAPGIDYLLPYWMIRYLTEVARPAVSPLPAWPGPAFD